MPPLLDVNVVLTSSMFMDTFIVTQRVSGVDEHGRTTTISTQITATGIIQPAGANTQERPKEYAAGRKSVLIHTAFRLRDQTQGFIPDLVTWRGDDYLIETVEDYTNYGRGFVQAYGTSQDLQDEPPND